MKQLNTPDYYVDVVQCNAGCPYVKNRNANPSIESRFIPRGSTSRCMPGNAILMVILANPGKPQEGVEDQHYLGKSGKELASAAWSFTEAVCERLHSPSFSRLGATRSATHDNLMKHLAYDVFQCQINQVLDYAVITNIVKCSTFNQNAKSEQYNFSKLDDDIQDKISTECIKRHLIKEIDYWKPRKTLVCGKPANRIFQTLKSEGCLELHIDFQTHHPSAMGKFIEERKQEFLKIGNIIRSECKI